MQLNFYITHKELAQWLSKCLDEGCSLYGARPTGDGNNHTDVGTLFATCTDTYLTALVLPPGVELSRPQGANRDDTARLWSQHVTDQPVVEVSGPAAETNFLRPARIYFRPKDYRGGALVEKSALATAWAKRAIRKMRRMMIHSPRLSLWMTPETMQRAKSAELTLLSPFSDEPVQPE